MARYVITVAEKEEFLKVGKEIGKLKGVNVEASLSNIHIVIVSSSESGIKNRLQAVKGVVSVENEGEVSTQ